MILAKVDSVEIRRIPDTDIPHSIIDRGRYEGVPADEAARYLEADKERLKSYEAGDWEYVGVQAIAKVRLYLYTAPDGQVGSFELSSGGLWGIESDSGEDHFAEIEADERADLADMLGALGLRTDDDRGSVPYGRQPITDAEAMNRLNAFLNRPGPWNGGDVCEEATTLCVQTNREILENGEEDEDECDCYGQGVDGALYPMASNGDSSLRWIERCDDCQVFASDEDAAVALMWAGVIPGYRMAKPNGSTSEVPYAVDKAGRSLPWESGT